MYCYKEKRMVNLGRGFFSRLYFFKRIRTYLNISPKRYWWAMSCFCGVFDMLCIIPRSYTWIYTRTPSLHVISCLYRNWFHVPKSHIPLSCLIRKMLHVPYSNPIILGNKVKVIAFCIAWWDFNAVPRIFWKVHPKIIKQLKQEGRSLPKHIR